jgi:hypothetical protein
MNDLRSFLMQTTTICALDVHHFINRNHGFHAVMRFFFITLGDHVVDAVDVAVYVADAVVLVVVLAQ